MRRTVAKTPCQNNRGKEWEKKWQGRSTPWKTMTGLQVNILTNDFHRNKSERH
jgi:hypothetical protein